MTAAYHVILPKFLEENRLPRDFDQGRCEFVLDGDSPALKSGDSCPAAASIYGCLKDTMNVAEPSSFSWKGVNVKPRHGHLAALCLSEIKYYSVVGGGGGGRPAVCGDGIMDFTEECEFKVQCGSFLVPPDDYHCPYDISREKSMAQCYKSCRWGPGDKTSCRPGLEEKEIFLHYCGNGVVEYSDDVHPALNDPAFQPFSTICDYYDEENMIPIYCNATINPSWNPVGLTYFKTKEFSNEFCDLGRNNGKPGYGCSSKCTLLCLNGEPDMTTFPQLYCKQPCNPGWTGKYCDVPLCKNGDPTFLSNGDLTCTCKPGWFGEFCDQTFCKEWKDGRCISCIDGHENTENFCREKTPESLPCLHGTPDPSSPIGACLGPCTNPLFSGPFCNITRCLEFSGAPSLWNLFSYGGEVCLTCVPGYHGDYCQETDCNTENGVIDELHPQKFCASPCANSRFIGPFCNITNYDDDDDADDDDGVSCKTGFEGQVCSRFRCVNGVVDVLDVQKSAPRYECLENSCRTGWTGPYCDVPLCKVFEPTAEALSRSLFSEWKQNLEAYESVNALENAILSGNAFGSSFQQHLAAVKAAVRRGDFQYIEAKIDLEVMCLENGKEAPTSKCLNGLADPEDAKGRCRPGSCFQGWAGELCDTKSCMHGTMRQGTCHCDEGWIGEHCDLPRCKYGEYDAAAASQEGTCSWCFPGYEGKYCDQRVCPNGIFNPAYDWQRNSTVPRCREGSCQGAYFGPNCDLIACAEEDFDVATKLCRKCADGYGGPKCRDVVPPTMPKVKGKFESRAHHVSTSRQSSGLPKKEFTGLREKLQRTNDQRLRAAKENQKTSGFLDLHRSTWVLLAIIAGLLMLLGVVAYVVRKCTTARGKKRNFSQAPAVLVDPCPMHGQSTLPFYAGSSHSLPQPQPQPQQSHMAFQGLRGPFSSQYPEFEFRPSMASQLHYEVPPFSTQPYAIPRSSMGLYGGGPDNHYGNGCLRDRCELAAVAMTHHPRPHKPRPPARTTSLPTRSTFTPSSASFM